MHKLTVIGGGPGGREWLLPIALEKIEQADIVIADKRYIPLIAHKDVRPMGQVMEAVRSLGLLLMDYKVAVVVSGDPLMYSLYKTIRKVNPEAEIEVIPGIGSMQLFAALLGETTENAQYLSAHGRLLSEGKLAMEVACHEKVFLLCDGTKGPSWIAGALLSYGLGDIKMCAAVHLSYDNQSIRCGKPEDFAGESFDSLCVVFIKNENWRPFHPKPLLKDEDFIRGKTPMTKEEVRWTIVGKLGLKPDAVVWDIGAGTGSVSAECARQCPFGSVYAVERSEAAVQLIEKNREKFQLSNLYIHKGGAGEAIQALPVPDAVFIGGSGRELKDILAFIQSIGSGIKVMVSCVTMETLAEAVACFQDGFEGADMLQMNISRSKTLGRYHILESHNPISLLWGVTK